MDRQTILSPVFRDKVLGCWMGKNCGGTLGAPLEKTYGDPDPFDVWWYPEIREGGIPNDDLEMQMIWLKALEEKGPDLKAQDLAQYWLDHIGYNWDEYGISKTNLRLGLLPPTSGSFNNWFVDCMGCPIRSEIWACVAPGQPQIAVQLAYEDAICDHAGGEGVFGEMFNTAIESSAFVLRDPDSELLQPQIAAYLGSSGTVIETLIAIGRSYVPDYSETAKAIDAAVNAHREGLSWVEARRRVIDATPNLNAQYSPINMGFEVIGLLYGLDFGDAICKAVNCGYDTDCTGATVGSILGILYGANALPVKWTGPLGTAISTNESWGGLKQASTGTNPVPVDLDDLTDRTIVQALCILDYFTAEESPEIVDLSSLYATVEIKMLWESPSCSIEFDGTAIHATVDYGEAPTISAAQAKLFTTTIKNTRAAELNGVAQISLPEGWRADVKSRSITIPIGSSIDLHWMVAAQNNMVLFNRNEVSVKFRFDERTAERDIPIVLIGKRTIRVSGTYGSGTRDDLQSSYPPELPVGDVSTADGRPGAWKTAYSDGHALDLTEIEGAVGVHYVQQFLWSESAREINVGVPATAPTKLWFNSELVLTCPEPRWLRPNYGGDGTSYVNVQVKPGWNEVLAKYSRSSDDPKLVAHLIFSDPAKHSEGIIDLLWTRFPWDNKS